MQIEALKPAQFYLPALWVPFFALNIVGEELWWRGFIQTRQEPVFGAATWVLQGFLHLAFHASFGPGVMFILLPGVCHTLGRAAHGQYILGHLCPRRHQWSCLPRGDARAAAVRTLVVPIRSFRLISRLLASLPVCSTTVGKPHQVQP